MEITKPRTKPLLISTWYRPPDSPMYHFDYFENIVEKVDMTNQDYFLLGDINVNLMPGVTSVNATKLNDIFEIFGLKQLIVDPTRTTLYSLVFKVTAIFKKGKKDEMNNYRPISVISVVAKIFEKLIFEQLYEYLNNNNLISASQSGFRTLHSTLTALIETVDNWSINIDNGLLNGVIFIDLKKAFDTIDHAILLRKLQIYGVDQNGIKFFESYLSNRKDVVLMMSYQTLSQ